MTPPTEFFACSDVTIWQGDSRTAWQHLPEQSVDAIVTSPPYFGLRDYGVGAGWIGGDEGHNHDDEARDDIIGLERACPCGAVWSAGQVGLEPSPDEYVNDLADLLTGYGERVLKPGGSLWLNLGDTYSAISSASGSPSRTLVGTDQGVRGTPHRTLTKRPDFPAKCLLMIPERVALALISRGWILRNRVVWAKPNGMPSSVRDRLATKHEALFHLVRQPMYFYDLDAIRQPYSPNTESFLAMKAKWQENRTKEARMGEEMKSANKNPNDGLGPGQKLNPAGANPGDVWTIPTQPYPDAHFAVFPPELVRRPILATVPEGGTVLDPFFGSGTTGVMARRLGRRTVGVELSADYCALAADRFRQDVLL